MQEGKVCLNSNLHSAAFVFLFHFSFKFVCRSCNSTFFALLYSGSNWLPSSLILLLLLLFYHHNWMLYSFSYFCSLPVRSRDYVIYSVARPLQQKGAKRGTLFILSLVSLVLTAQLCCVCEIRLGGKTKLCPWCWKERSHTLWPSCFFSIFIFYVLFVATVIWSMASVVCR